MNYLRIKNWTDHQAYKDGRPVSWIKLQLALLDDYDFELLTEIQQLHLVKIWLLAGKLDNEIPADPDWVGRKIGAQSEVDLDALIQAGFLVPYESVRIRTNPYADSEPSVRDRTNPYREPHDSVPREEESREEKSISTTSSTGTGPLEIDEAILIAATANPKLEEPAVRVAWLKFQSHKNSKRHPVRLMWIRWVQTEHADQPNARSNHAKRKSKSEQLAEQVHAELYG